MRLLNAMAVWVMMLLAGVGPWLAAQGPVDATGVRFNPPGRVERVVSLAPSLTEEIFALGAGSQLIADTELCRYPLAALAKIKIGSMLSPDLERIVALHPDLVIATLNGNRPGTVAQLRRLGLPVFVMGGATGFADIAAQFRTLAGLVGRSGAAGAILSGAEAQIAATQARTARQAPVRTFFVVQQTPLVSANNATFIGEALRDAGAVNVTGTAAAAYPEVSLEAVLQADPQVILVDDEQADPARAVSGWLGLPGLVAARTRRVYLVPSHLFDSPTPMTFAAAVRTAAALLHPEAR